MDKEMQLKIGTKLKLIAGNDKDRVFIILSELHPCARTEGCYRAKYENTGVEVYIFPSTLKELGYTLLN